MGILGSARHEEEIGGRPRRLLITNREIERFEAHNGGIFDFWDQLFGHASGLKATHVRDLVALALVGGGMPDAEAERAVAEMGPDRNPDLRAIAQRALGLAWFPQALTATGEKKSLDGSAAGADDPHPEAATTPEGA